MLALAAVLPLALCVSACASTGTSFVALDELPGGPDIAYAYAISAHGDLVVGESFSGISSVHGEGVRWVRSGGTWTAAGLGLPLPPPTPLNSPALGLASDGTVVVGRVSFDPATSAGIDTLAYCWRASGGFRFLPMPAVSPAFVVAQAQSATEGGARVVGWGSAEVGYAHPLPLVWTGSYASGWTSTEILPPGLEGMAVGIDEPGRTVIGWARSPDSASRSRNGVAHEAACWRWKAGSWRLAWLGALPNQELYSQANGLSRNNGLWVVGFSGDPAIGSAPVRWRVPDGVPHQIEMLDLLPGLANGSANAVSKNGKRVVGNGYGERDGEFVSDAFVWDEGRGSRSLKEQLVAAGLPGVGGWTLTSATGISDDGTVICGYGVDPTGIERAWVATIP